MHTTLHTCGLLNSKYIEDFQNLLWIYHSLIFLLSFWPTSYLLHLILLLHATTMQNSYRWFLLSSSLRTGFPQWASSELNKDKPWKWEYFYESLDRSNKTNWNAFFWELQTTYGYLAAVFHNYHGSETDGFQSNWGHCESRMGIVQVIMSQRLLPLP